jgi:release factor glutamine methyltransferase
MTTVGELLTGATDQLTAAGVPSPAHDARELLAHVLDRRPPLLGRTDPVSPEQSQRYAALLARRRARVPLQHLTGEAPFRHLILAVGPGAFVPRPETEVMTGWAIDRLRERPADDPPAVVVDLCTGSGAIAKAVATEVPGTRVSAVELSPEAHAWAERNLADTDVTLLLGDMADALPELDGTVDLVIANPPYVPLDAYDSVVAEARDHDPTLALFSGDDGLDAIRVLTRTAARLLRPGGLLTFEHAEVQSEAAPDVVVASGVYRTVRDHLDLTGRPRFVTAVRTASPLAGWVE